MLTTNGGLCVQRVRRLRLAEAEAGDDDRGGGGDTEEDREVSLLQLRLAALQAGEQRAMLRQARIKQCMHFEVLVGCVRVLCWDIEQHGE